MKKKKKKKGDCIDAAVGLELEVGSWNSVLVRRKYSATADTSKSCSFNFYSTTLAHVFTLFRRQKKQTQNKLEQHTATRLLYGTAACRPRGATHDRPWREPEQSYVTSSPTGPAVAHNQVVLTHND
jgi:hypothetical protein